MKHNLSENEKRLYSGSWVDTHHNSDKVVTCVRCYSRYNLANAKRSVPKKPTGYYIKEPQCECGCRLYISN